jgi:hypothetical protein
MEVGSGGGGVGEGGGVVPVEVGPKFIAVLVGFGRVGGSEVPAGEQPVK